MRKSVLAKCAKAALALMAALLALALVPTRARAADADALTTALNERVEWAKSQGLTKMNALAEAEGGDTDASVHYFQEFDSEYRGVERTFEYRLVPLDDSCPMPAGTENGVFAWTFTDDAAGWINIDCSNVSVNEGEKVFYYAAYQHVSSPQEGYTYDSAVFYVDVHVLANGHGVVANVRNSNVGANKVDDPGWTVKYQRPTAEPTNTAEPTDTTDPAGATPAPKVVQSGTYNSTYQPSPRARVAAAPLAKTGDLVSFGVIALVAIAAIALLATGVLARRRNGGGRDE